MGRDKASDVNENKPLRSAWIIVLEDPVAGVNSVAKYYLLLGNEGFPKKYPR